MYLPDPIGTLAAAFYDAPKHMPEVKETRVDYANWDRTDRSNPAPMKEEIRPAVASDLEVYAMFEQSWGSTALGFGGIGGQAISSAYTIIIWNGLSDYVVYFNGRSAYRVNDPNKKFFEDVAGRSMASVREAGRYE